MRLARTVIALAVLSLIVGCADEPATTNGSVFLFATELHVQVERVQYVLVVDDDPGEEASRLRASVAAAFRASMSLVATRREPGRWRPVDVEAVVVRPSGEMPHAMSARMTWRAGDADEPSSERFAAAVASELSRAGPGGGRHAPLEAARQAWKELALPSPERRTVLVVASARDDESPLPTGSYAVSSFDVETQAITDTTLVSRGEAFDDESCRSVSTFAGDSTPPPTRLEAWGRASEARAFAWPCALRTAPLFGELGAAILRVRLPESAETCRVVVGIPSVQCAAERGWREPDVDRVRSPVDDLPITGRVCEVIASCVAGTSGYCLDDREVRFLGGALPSPGYVGLSCELRR
jgi:hypothetical protein